MLIISPRSYVTAAFDLLFPELAQEIEEWLKRLRPNDWWQYYIYEQRMEIFGERELLNREQHYKKPFPNIGNLNDLIEQFDEHYLHCLINKSPTRPERKDGRDYEMSKMISELTDYRNDWAHRGKRAPKEVVADEKVWAEVAIDRIKEIAVSLQKPLVVKRISILLFKMKCDWIDDDTILPPRTKMLDWLRKEVVDQVTAPSSPIGKKTKERVEKSFDNLEKYVMEASEKTATRYIIDYFWNAIRGKTDVYTAIALEGKKDKVPTFEDVVEKFTKFCYNEK